MGTRDATARTSRTLRSRTFSALLSRVMSAHEVTDAALAEVLGVSRARVEQWRRTDHPSILPASDLPLLVGLVGPEPLELLAQLAGYSLQPLMSGAESDAETATINAVAMRETGEALASVADALQDGTMSRTEAVTALSEIDDAIRALYELRARVAAKAE